MKTMTGVLAFTTFACLLTTGKVPGAVFAQPVEADLAAVFSSARTVFIAGFAGRQMMDRLWANPDGARAEIKVKAVLSEWGKYEIVEDPRTADLVLVVTRHQGGREVPRLRGEGDEALITPWLAREHGRCVSRVCGCRGHRLFGLRSDEPSLRSMTRLGTSFVPVPERVRESK